MGQLFTKINNTQKLEEINLLKMENDNLKKKNNSMEKYILIMEKEIFELRQDYESIIIKLSQIIK